MRCAGDAWEHLKSFVSILKAIATAMSKMVEKTSAEADPVVWTFTKLAHDFQEKHKLSIRQWSRDDGTV